MWICPERSLTPESSCAHESKNWSPNTLYPLVALRTNGESCAPRCVMLLYAREHRLGEELHTRSCAMANPASVSNNGTLCISKTEDEVGVAVLYSSSWGLFQNAMQCRCCCPVYSDLGLWPRDVVVCSRRRQMFPPSDSMILQLSLRNIPENSSLHSKKLSREGQH